MSPRSFRYPTWEITSVNPVIITKHSTTRKCCHPKCAGYTMGKGQQRNSRTSASRLSDHVLSRDILKPGELIFVDQFESSIKGRLSSAKGKESETLQYVGGTICVDAATGFTKIYNQFSLRTGDTLQNKQSFKNLGRQYGIQIKGFHGDNGIFKS